MFKYVLTPQLQAASAGKSWMLPADLKIATTNSPADFVLFLDGFNGGYGLNFGSDSNGDQYVEYLGGSAALGGTVTLPGSNYNNYQVRYDPSADTVSLWINGAEYVNNFSANRADYLTDMGWGGGADVGLDPLANWNLVSLTIPEPSSAALFGVGTLIVAARRFRERH